MRSLDLILQSSVFLPVGLLSHLSLAVKKYVYVGIKKKPL